MRTWNRGPSESKTMTDQRCGTCRHYAPTRNEKTGRVLSSMAGQCKWTPPVFHVLSAAYSSLHINGSYAPQWPTKHAMWPDNGNTCQTWEKK